MPTLYGTFTRIDLADGVLVAMADDTTVRVCAAPSPDVERLTADVARLEREAVDLTHGRDVAHRAILAAAARRQQLISDLGVAERRCSTLTAEADGLARELAALRAAVIAAASGVAPDAGRYGHHVGVALGRTAQLHREAAHRAAGDGVDLTRYVLRSEVVAALLSDALDSELVSKLHTSGAARDALRSCARTTRGLAARFRGDLRSEAVEGGEQKAVEGAGGHGASVATAGSDRKGPQS